ncbi:damX-related protein [Vibrio ishigakensis]|uniref:DamX-related protein n=1 Tax=Vibrio ishigakensis TaxID=1481914 RepID=A0A0B8PAX6_9VIBR|nr:damX-related protein [Vibrio ishigakensis]
MKKTAIISLALLLAACSSSDEYQTEVQSESYQEQYQTEQVAEDSSEAIEEQDANAEASEAPVVEEQDAIVEEEVAQTEPKAEETTEEVTVSSAPSQGFAIQLATLSDHDKAVKLAQSFKAELPMWLQSKLVGEKQVYSVLMGDFGDYDQTKSTIASLPQELQMLKPFVKNFTDKELADAEKFEAIQ